MRSVAQNPSMKNPILGQNGAHSRNQNQLAPSSKTHSESMIYNGNGGSMGGSFSQGMAMQPKKTGGQGSLGPSRPMTGYTAKQAAGASKKKQNATVGSDQSFRQEQYQAHVINQSLKPKMIHN